MQSTFDWRNALALDVKKAEIERDSDLNMHLVQGPPQTTTSV